ncbi:MAG: hypothetical protein ACO26G_02155 [Rickettsiales bacterium]|jgi:hypothetical protein
MLKKIFILTFLLLFSCRMPDNFGFYQPITMDLRVPDGPPEFKAGWHAGCKSALANRNFQNSFVYQDKYGPNYGQGTFQHDSAFQTGWRVAFFACVTHAGMFTAFNSMQHMPLSK